MADNPDDRGPQDRSRVALGQDYEVRYWTEKYGVSKEKLQEAVGAVGNSATAVEKYLASRK